MVTLVIGASLVPCFIIAVIYGWYGRVRSIFASEDESESRVWIAQWIQRFTTIALLASFWSFVYLAEQATKETSMWIAAAAIFSLIYAGRIVLAALRFESLGLLNGRLTPLLPSVPGRVNIGSPGL